MKKIILVYFSLCLFHISSCNSQEKINLEYQNDIQLKEIGIGLIQQIDIKQQIILYEDFNCKKIKTKDAKLGKDIIPLLNKIDYSILFFICIEKSNDFYKIVTSYGNYAYIKPSDCYKFYNWYDFLKNKVASIESKNKITNPEFDSINGTPINLKNIQYDDEIEIIAIKEDWLNINNFTIKKNYWIKWKDKNELLIYINLLM